MAVSVREVKDTEGKRIDHIEYEQGDVTCYLVFTDGSSLEVVVEPDYEWED